MEKSPSLLLISNSLCHGMEMFDHCRPELEGFISGCASILFVPYASADTIAYSKKIKNRLHTMGITAHSLADSTNPAEDIRKATCIFVGGGNTFLLLRCLYRLGLVELIRNCVLQGTRYIGSSAGANIACPTIGTTNDMPVIWPQSPRALGLVPFNINPHYIDPDPSSRHMGESRDTRIQEFQTLNSRPVIGLREGAWLRIEGVSGRLEGANGARLFVNGQKPVELVPGSAIDNLLS